MSENKPMTVGERIRYIKDQLSNAFEKYQYAQRIGGVSCFAVGYENGKIESLKDELKYLEGLYNGECAEDLIINLTLATELIGHLYDEIDGLKSQIEFGSKFIERMSLREIGRLTSSDGIGEK